MQNRVVKDTEVITARAKRTENVMTMDVGRFKISVKLMAKVTTMGPGQLREHTEMTHRTSVTINSGWASVAHAYNPG
jgi:hypothetical protein